MNDYINEKEVRRMIKVIKPNGQLFEIRIMLPGKKNLSGYFTDADTAVEKLKTNINLKNAIVYFTLNYVDPGCYSRLQRDHFEAFPENATTDADIIGYNWLMVDLDPKRPTGASSSDEELQKARALGEEVKKYLKVRGFSEPLMAMSGNGIHLLYKVGLKNTDENKALIKRCLQALDLVFSNDDIKVDTSTFNPARICKMYGTLAQKGSNTPERPHRMSRILSEADSYTETPKAYLEKFADDVLPKEQKPEAYNNYRPQSFDIETWMARYGIQYKEKKQSGTYTKYVLDECPFNSNHKAPDSMITVGDNGKIGFYCFHNSCQDKHWQDVRIKYEPNAYEKAYGPDEDDSWIDAGWKAHKANRTQNIQPINVEEVQEELEGRPMWLTPKQIRAKETQSEVFIKTGIEGIDNRMRGLKKGSLTVVSGLRGSGKSTVLSQVVLSALSDGFNVICYSGELTDKNFWKWMSLQAAGKGNTVPDKWSGYYKVPDDIDEKIADWMEGHFWLYENDYGNKYSILRRNLERQADKVKADLIILDNLMALNIRDLNPHDKYDAQTSFINDLSSLAKRTNTHIIFVAHPRKAIGFLRLDDISGSADLSNMVDNAFIVHRKNEDFKRLTEQMFKWSEDAEAYKGTNVVEIAKDRDGGTQDVFIPLWYEKESKRLKNSEAEMVAYGWENDFQQIEEDEVIPF